MRDIENFFSHGRGLLENLFLSARDKAPKGLFSRKKQKLTIITQNSVELGMQGTLRTSLELLLGISTRHDLFGETVAITGIQSDNITAEFWTPIMRIHRGITTSLSVHEMTVKLVR